LNPVPGRGGSLCSAGQQNRVYQITRTSTRRSQDAWRGV